MQSRLVVEKLWVDSEDEKKYHLLQSKSFSYLVKKKPLKRVKSNIRFAHNEANSGTTINWRSLVFL